MVTQGVNMHMYAGWGSALSSAGNCPLDVQMGNISLAAMYSVCTLCSATQQLPACDRTQHWTPDICS